MKDRDAKGRAADHAGEKNGRSKLTKAQVQEILTSTMTQRSLAAKYGVGQSVVGRIRHGEDWRHL